MIDYKIACEKFGKGAVDALHSEVGQVSNKQVVTDGKEILICNSVGSAVPECYERVQRSPDELDNRLAAEMLSLMPRP